MYYAVRVTEPRRTSSEGSVRSLRLLRPRLSPLAPVSKGERLAAEDDWQADDEGALQRQLVVSIHEVWAHLPPETPRDLSRVLLRIAKCHQESDRQSRGTSP